MQIFSENSAPILSFKKRITGSQNTNQFILDEIQRIPELLLVIHSIIGGYAVNLYKVTRHTAEYDQFITDDLRDAFDHHYYKSEKVLRVVNVPFKLTD